HHIAPSAEPHRGGDACRGFHERAIDTTVDDPVGLVQVRLDDTAQDDAVGGDIDELGAEHLVETVDAAECSHGGGAARGGAGWVCHHLIPPCVSCPLRDAPVASRTSGQ